MEAEQLKMAARKNAEIVERINYDVGYQRSRQWQLTQERFGASAGTRYRNPLILQDYNDVSIGKHRWFVANNDPVAKALGKNFIDRALSKPLSYFSLPDAENPFGQPLKVNADLVAIAKEVEAKDYWQRAGIRQFVHGWQATFPEKEGDELYLDKCYSGHEIEPFQIKRASRADALINLQHRQKLAEYSKQTKEYFRHGQISELQYNDYFKQLPNVPRLKVNDPIKYQVAFIPDAPLFETRQFFHQQDYRWYDRSEAFHTTNGTWNNGLGNSGLEGAWDSIVKLGEVSENNHFRQSLFYDVVFDPDWKDPQAQEYVNRFLYALNNKKVFGRYPRINTQNGQIDLAAPAWNIHNAANAVAQPTKSDTNNMMGQLSPQWGYLSAVTGYSLRWFLGNPGGALAAANADVISDLLNDIYRFSNFTEYLIIPFWKLLQSYGILGNINIDFDQVIVKTHWQVELEAKQTREMEAAVSAQTGIPGGHGLPAGGRPDIEDERKEIPEDRKTAKGREPKKDEKEEKENNKSELKIFQLIQQGLAMSMIVHRTGASEEDIRSIKRGIRTAKGLLSKKELTTSMIAQRTGLSNEMVKSLKKDIVAKARSNQSFLLRVNAHESRENEFVEWFDTNLEDAGFIPRMNPFAGYSDFDDCVSKNRDKDDPEAYCGEIKKRTEDKQNDLLSVVNPEQLPETKMDLEEQIEFLEDLKDRKKKELKAVKILKELFGPEEEDEPGMYVKRPLVNTAQLYLWAKEHGFDPVDEEEFHTTVAYSRVEFGMLPLKDHLTITPENFQELAFLGEEGAVVLKFNSPELQTRWQEFRDVGATWDFDSYIPHITIAYNIEGLDLSTIPLPDFALLFGPEKTEDLDPDYEEKTNVEKTYDDDALIHKLVPQLPRDQIIKYFTKAIEAVEAWLAGIENRLQLPQFKEREKVIKETENPVRTKRIPIETILPPVAEVTDLKEKKIKGKQLKSTITKSLEEYFMEQMDEYPDQMIQELEGMRVLKEMLESRKNITYPFMDIGSTNVDRAAYDDQANQGMGKMWLQFQGDDRSWSYDGVSEQQFQSFLQSPSRGGWVWQNLRGKQPKTTWQYPDFMGSAHQWQPYGRSDGRGGGTQPPRHLTQPGFGQTIAGVQTQPVTLPPAVGPTMPSPGMAPGPVTAAPSPVTGQVQPSTVPSVTGVPQPTAGPIPQRAGRPQTTAAARQFERGVVPIEKPVGPGRPSGRVIPATAIPKPAGRPQTTAAPAIREFGVIAPAKPRPGRRPRFAPTTAAFWTVNPSMVVPQPQEMFRTNQVNLSKSEIPKELLQDDFAYWYKSINNAGRKGISGHGKSKIYQMLREGEQVRRSNRVRVEVDFERETDEDWYLIANSMSASNPFNYLVDGRFRTEYMCPQDIKKNVGRTGLFGAYHDKVNDSIGLPEEQVIGKFKVLAYDAERKESVECYRVNKQAVRDYFERSNEEDWITPAIESGNPPDVSNTYDCRVNFDKQHKVYLQTEFLVETISFVPRGNCSEPFCTVTVAKLNASMKECILEEIPKVKNKYRENGGTFTHQQVIEGATANCNATRKNVKKGEFETPSLWWAKDPKVAKEYGNFIIAFERPKDFDYQDGFGGFGTEDLSIEEEDLYVPFTDNQGGEHFIPIALWDYSENDMDPEEYEDAVELNNPVYHGTSEKNINKIEEEGLKPGFNTGSTSPSKSIRDVDGDGKGRGWWGESGRHSEAAKKGGK